jgi:hypothetical protein
VGAPDECPFIRLGDIVEKIAKPIAKALGLKCHDKATGKLKPGTPCHKRKAALNKLSL